MGGAKVEHDFMGMEKSDPSSSPVVPLPHRRHTFHGISKINPEIVKSVLASASNTSPHHNLYPQLPLFPSSQISGEKKEEEVERAPMTLFYKGNVSVFDLPKDKAELILKFANNSTNDAHFDHPSSSDDGDLPIKRKKSLQRFFEKRKERLISVYPYPADHVSRLDEKSLA